MYTILGAGLSGLSAADHLSKKGVPYIMYEAKSHGGGHIYSEAVDGFTWDEGPHVSFTPHEYVKNYFAHNCEQQFLEYKTNPTNFYKDTWIPHPAQSNMYAIAEPLRTECINDVIRAREEQGDEFEPKNYQDWIDYAFGKTFAQCFPGAYTRKYWTTKPENLTTDWIGKRIYFPEITDMVDSAEGPLAKQTHYINKVRYPLHGGYYSFIRNVEKKLQIIYNKKLKYISFRNKELLFEDGGKATFVKLISTLPLPQMIINSDAPDDIKLNALKLKCSQVLIVNVVVDHPVPVANHWIYVYDEDFYTTRINFTELLSGNNGEPGKSGIQVEVYFSAYHPLTKPVEEIEKAVLNELIKMKLIKAHNLIQSYHSKWIDWANVIFDKSRVSAQDTVLGWLEKNGLMREADDLEPMTDWDTKPMQRLGDIILAGRFAQWKYFWTDDCVLRGKYVSEAYDI